MNRNNHNVDLKKDMLFILKELLNRNKLTEAEYFRVVDSVRRGNY